MEGLMRMLALPVLGYGLPVLARPSAKAVKHLEAAYNFALRLAYSGRNSRTRAANAVLKWPEYREWCEAATEGFVMRVWVDGVPRRLRGELGEAYSCQTEMGRVLFPEEMNKVIGEKCFCHWGREVVSRVLSKRPPVAELSDADAELGVLAVPHRLDPHVEVVYLSSLRHDFRHDREWWEGGRLVIWTDGSHFEYEGVARAGAGVFYGAGNTLNA
eukprot:Hpha_TRINITY_DN15788_c2_g1::TRINITY_DN15788_c2_g1_i1::g.41802::m.41802